MLIDINSIKIWVETFGNKKGRPIILIAGAMAPLVFWDKEFCKRLADDGCFVIRFDNRDIGFSTHFEPCRPNSATLLPYTIDNMVEDAAGILDYFKIQKAVIAGHSLGATIAQLFAVKYPHRTEKLFLLASPIIAKGKNQYIETDEQTKRQLWDVLLSNKMYPDYENGKDEFFRVWNYLNGSYELDESMAAEYTKRLYETEHIEPAWNHTKVQENIRDIYDELNALPINIHFIYGETDYLSANLASIQILVNSLQNADLEILSGAGHLFFNCTLWETILKIFVKRIKM
ncbi:MAG: alpha/beta fold hydrolase [Leptospirales bacterium]|nr:alpha/beta fold hydrolase [Leptospirales bacterium]